MGVRNRGFTLIELTVVIILLGILSAVALPRFASSSSAARVAAYNGLAGAIGSAVSMAQAQYRVTGNTTATTVSMEGTNVDVVAGSTALAGVPRATNAGINTALANKTGFTSPAIAGSVATYYLSTLPSSLQITSKACRVDYDDSTGVATVYSSDC